MARGWPAGAAARAAGTGVAGTAPTKIPRPASTASASTSSSPRRSTPRSIPAPSAPAPLMMPRGADIPQQCTTVAAARGGQHRPQARLGVRLLDRPDPVQPARARHPAAQHGGQRRLVQLEQQPGAGHPGAHPGHVRGHPLGQRRGQVPDRARVGQHGLLAAGQLQAGRHRPRPADLQLQRALVAVGHLFQRVEVAGEQGLRAADVPARAGRRGASPGWSRPRTGRSAAPRSGRSCPRPRRGPAARPGEAGPGAHRR